MSGYSLTGYLAPLAANTAGQILWGVVSGSATADGYLYLADCTFDSASLGQGVRIELFRATGGIPTATTYTANKETGDAQLATAMASVWITTTAAAVTATPTGVTVMRTWYVSPASGLLTQWSLSREIYTPAGATQWTGLRVSTPAGVSPDVAYNASWAE